MSYFATWYLQITVAIAFRVIWTIVYNNSQLMGHFCRLASPGGVTEKDALDSLYLSMGSTIPEPVQALLYGHCYTFLVSGITYLIEQVAPLSSESPAVDVHHCCTPDPDTDPNHPWPPGIAVRLVPARVLGPILCLIAEFVIFPMYCRRHHPSSVYSDLSSMAVMASLLRHLDMLQDFKHLHASNRGLERAVLDQTYSLSHYQSEGESMKYGIVSTVKVTMPNTGNKSDHSIVANPESGAGIRSHDQGISTRHLFRTIEDIAIAIALLGVFGVTLRYYLDSHNDGFNVFFDSDSNSFGPRSILSFAGGVAVSPVEVTREKSEPSPSLTLHALDLPNPITFSVPSHSKTLSPTFRALPCPLQKSANSNPTATSPTPHLPPYLSTSTPYATHPPPSLSPGTGPFSTMVAAVATRAEGCGVAGSMMGDWSGCLGREDGMYDRWDEF